MKNLLLILSILASLNAQNVTLDTGTSLLWQDNADVKSKRFTYKEAQAYCSNLVLDKYSDFQIPTINELQSIVDYRNHNPVILKGFLKPAAEDFWTSTPYVYSKGSMWTIDFKKGSREPAGERYSKHLRCVQHVK